MINTASIEWRRENWGKRVIGLTTPVAQHNRDNLAGSTHAVRVTGAFAVRIGKSSQCHLTSQDDGEGGII